MYIDKFFIREPSLWLRFKIHNALPYGIIFSLPFVTIAIKLGRKYADKT